MPRAREVLMIVTASGMELCRLYCLISFFFSLLSAGQIPPAGGIVAFGLAVALWLFTGNRGWRIIYVLGLNLLVLALTILVAIYAGDNWAASFLSSAWLAEAGAGFQDFSSGTFLAATVLFIILSWISGLCLARRRLVYSTMTSRFDLGILVFFFLFLIEGGLGVQVPVLTPCLFLFFPLGMLSIALAHSRGSAKKETPLHLRKLGFVFLLSAVMLLLFMGATFFFLPGMSPLAKTGYLYGKRLFNPLLNFFLSVLRFLFCRRTPGQGPISSGVEGGGSLSAIEIGTGGGAPLWEKALTWGMLALFGIALLFAAGWGFYRLCSWLFTRAPGRGKTASLRQLLSVYFTVLWQRCRSILLSCTKIFSKSVPHGVGWRGYKKLLSWGRSGGFPHRPAETPGEYGARLGRYFPLFLEEIATIVDGYHDETYGGLGIGGPQGKRISLAWRRLASPLCWPLRVKTRLLTAVKDAE